MSQPPTYLMRHIWNNVPKAEDKGPQEREGDILLINEDGNEVSFSSRGIWERERERERFLPKQSHGEAAWKMIMMIEMGKERKKPGRGKEEDRTVSNWERKDRASSQGRAARSSLSTLNMRTQALWFYWSLKNPVPQILPKYVLVWGWRLGVGGGQKDLQSEGERGERALHELVWICMWCCWAASRKVVNVFLCKTNKQTKNLPVYLIPEVSEFFIFYSQRFVESFG